MSDEALPSVRHPPKQLATKLVGALEQRSKCVVMQSKDKVLKGIWVCVGEVLIAAPDFSGTP